MPSSESEESLFLFGAWLGLGWESAQRCGVTDMLLRSIGLGLSLSIVGVSTPGPGVSKGGLGLTAVTGVAVELFSLVNVELEDLLVLVTVWGMEVLAKEVLAAEVFELFPKVISSDSLLLDLDIFWSTLVMV